MSRRRALLLAVLLAASAAAWSNRHVFFYLAAHPAAFGLRSILLIGRWALLPLVVAAAFLLIAWGVGKRLLRLLVPLRLEGDALAPCWALGLGVGLEGTLFYALGLAGFFNLAGFALAGSALLVAAAPEIARLRLRLLPGRAPRWAPLLGAVLLYAAWHGFLHALAPIVDWDPLVYHMALPKLYLKWGGIQEIPWMRYSHWPHQTELLYAAAIALKLEPAAPLLHWALSWCLVLALFVFLRKEAGETEAWAGAAMLASSANFLALSGQAHSDGALALFAFLAMAALWSWRRDGGDGLLSLAGAFAGFAAASKLHGFVFAGLLAGWLFLSGPKASQTSRLRRVALYLAPVLLIAGPWLLRVWWTAGNPVWPILFGGRFGASRLAADLWRVEGMTRSFFIHLLTWPYGVGFFFGTALLLPAAALALGERPPELLRFLLWPVPFYALAVVWSSEFWRFLFPCQAFLAAGAAWGAGALARRRGVFAVVASGALGFSFLALIPAGQNGNELYPVLELASQTEPATPPRRVYLDRTLALYGAERAINKNAPDARVLLFEELRGYYLDADYLWGSPHEQRLVDYENIPDAAALGRRLRELGVDCVLVGRRRLDDRGNPVYSARCLSLMGALLKEARLVYSRNGVKVYRLRRRRERPRDLPPFSGPLLS